MHTTPSMVLLISYILEVPLVQENFSLKKKKQKQKNWSLMSLSRKSLVIRILLTRLDTGDGFGPTGSLTAFLLPTRFCDSRVCVYTQNS